MEAASNLIFDDDEDLDIQAVALKSYLLSLEANAVKHSDMFAANINHLTLSNCIIDF